MSVTASLFVFVSAFIGGTLGEDLCYSDAQCDTCYQCNDQGTRCVPIPDCHVSCYSDVDCQRNQFCNSAAICEEDPTTCYDTAECRVPQVCDLSIYQCVDPTPAPITPGCCAGTSSSSYSRCALASEEGSCSRMSSCYWISGEDADCEYDSEEPPIDPGCCMVTDETSMDSRWVEHCISFYDEADCLRPQNENGYARCQWIPTSDDYDCSLLWPTPEPEAGCCAGSSAYAAATCNSVSTQQECTNMASCHWIPGENVECEWDDEDTTTAPPPHTGCCTLDESQNENSGWAARCPEFWNEADCVEPKDGFAQNRCGWLDTDEYFDCC